MADRVEYDMSTTEVTHISHPEGSRRENPPHLHDFREFVAACEGLPDDLPVLIQKGASDGTGRRDVTFSVKQVLPFSAVRMEEKPYSIINGLKVWSKDG